MTWKDKAEIGLKEDALYRKDNLPPSQIRGPELPTGPGRSPEIPAARNDHNIVPTAATPQPRASKTRTTSRAQTGRAKRKTKQ